jgi:oligopeptide/dipeptide ABC transporter ATP-binding protein
MNQPIVAVRDLSKHFVMKGGWGRPTRTLRAVDGVSFEIAAGETLGLVGESGSGKSTTGRLLVGLLPATRGSVQLFGHEIANGARVGAIDPVRRRVQFVFQDPQGSLDPRMRVEAAIAEPLDVAGGLSRGDRADRVRELIGLVGLPRDCGERFPHEFSGGQRQRIGIARALALDPAFIVCDEPVSALDVSMQAQVVNLLLDLQDRLGLAYLFIAHDLAVVRNVSTRIAVMYAGAIVEIAPRRQLYATPRHPYTQALLASVPRPHPNRTRPRTVAGELPSLLDPPSGCAFHTRCPYAFDRCRVERPLLRPLAHGHLGACHLDAPPGVIIPILAAA